MASTVQTERLGIGAVQKIAAASGWFFRELPLPDEGIDAQLEGATSEGRPNGRLLGLQIKSGSSYFQGSTKGGWRYPIKPSNLNYWRSYSLPVVVVLYEPTADRAYWQVVRAEHLTETRSRRHTIFIPADQELGAATLPMLEELANEGLPPAGEELDAAVQGRRAQLDVAWMERLAAGDRLFVEAEEWLNKSSGRGSLRLIAEDERGTTVTEREWPWVFLPGASYATELPKIFPWARLAIDEDRYREETEAEFLVEHGAWDSETQRYVHEADFDEWFAKRYAGQLLPYGQEAGGEVGLWRLELTLNALGEETLGREHDEMYADALFDIQEQDRLASERANGHYELRVADLPAAQTFECVLFVTNDDCESIVDAASRVWSAEGGPLLVAGAILEHALGRRPTQAQAAAFVARFGRLFDGDGLTLSYSNLTEWLRELGVRDAR